MQDQGRNVAILSRGYCPNPLPAPAVEQLLFRGDTTPRVVSDGKSPLDSEMAGDEPYMLASNLKDVVVLSGQEPRQSGRYAIENSGATRSCWTTAISIGICRAAA